MPEPLHQPRTRLGSPQYLCLRGLGRRATGAGSAYPDQRERPEVGPPSASLSASGDPETADSDHIADDTTLSPSDANESGLIPLQPRRYLVLTSAGKPVFARYFSPF